MGLVMTDSEKEKTKNIARKKRSVSGDLQIDRNATPNVSFNKDEMSTKKSSHCNVIKEETSTLSIFQNSSTPNVASTSTAALDKMLQVVHDKDKSDSLGYFDCILVENSQLAMNQKWQFQDKLFLINQKIWKCRAAAAITVKLEKNSSVNVPAQFQFSNLLLQVEVAHISTEVAIAQQMKSVEMEGETELSDSASSISTVDVGAAEVWARISTLFQKEGVAGRGAVQGDFGLAKHGRHDGGMSLVDPGHEHSVWQDGSTLA
ncbi:hypothetical protein NC651_012359 [Populus alba x Populus x berolinensis]|nr:hypothetical protein NC651_012359 [Populus alba x Populus x berolinensis]